MDANNINETSYSVHKNDANFELDVDLMLDEVEDSVEVEAGLRRGNRKASGVQLSIVADTTCQIYERCKRSGVGRTGTFIALRNVMREAEDTGRVDFFTTVQRLRVDRMNMVQTADQYEFVHRAAQAAIVCMGTTVTATEVQRRLEILEQPLETGHTKLEMEFTELCHTCDSFHLGPHSETTGEREQNNDSKDSKKSVDDYKVRLTSDKTYKNGIKTVFIPSLTCPDHHILTNLPSSSTVNDFWRLVTQCKVSLIVAFDEDPVIDSSIGEYIPKEGDRTLKMPSLDIEVGAVTYGSQTEARQISITSTTQTNFGTSPYSNTEQSWTVTHLRCKTIDLDPSKVFALAKEIRSGRPVGEGRTLHMCRAGAAYSDLMCVVLLLLDRMEHDQHVMVPLVVGAVKTIKPQVISSLNQYRLLYEILRLRPILASSP